MKDPLKIRGHITSKEVALLQREAILVPPLGIIVEIGSFCGKSTVAMASMARPLVYIYAVDTWGERIIGKKNDPDRFPEFKENTAGYDNIIAIRGKSEDIGKYWNLKINLLFIDGDHTEDGAFRDLLFWAPHVVSGGTILMHDYSEPCGVKAAWLKYSKSKVARLVKKTDVVASTLRIRV